MSKYIPDEAQGSVRRAGKLHASSWEGGQGENSEEYQEAAGG